MSQNTRVGAPWLTEDYATRALLDARCVERAAIPISVRGDGSRHVKIIGLIVIDRRLIVDRDRR